VNEGPRLKRLWHRARGRADMLLKRMSHITVVVDEIARKGE
jgi:large subunit ribosomal protein L22